MNFDIITAFWEWTLIAGKAFIHSVSVVFLKIVNRIRVNLVNNILFFEINVSCDIYASLNFKLSLFIIEIEAKFNLLADNKLLWLRTLNYNWDRSIRHRNEIWILDYDLMSLVFKIFFYKLLSR